VFGPAPRCLRRRPTAQRRSRAPRLLANTTGQQDSRRVYVDPCDHRASRRPSKRWRRACPCLGRTGLLDCALLPIADMQPMCGCPLWASPLVAPRSIRHIRDLRSSLWDGAIGMGNFGGACAPSIVPQSLLLLTLICRPAPRHTMLAAPGAPGCCRIPGPWPVMHWPHHSPFLPGACPPPATQLCAAPPASRWCARSPLRRRACCRPQWHSTNHTKHNGLHE
jgi:hypothetical protein